MKSTIEQRLALRMLLELLTPYGVRFRMVDDTIQVASDKPIPPDLWELVDGMMPVLAESMNVIGMGDGEGAQ